MLEKLITNLKNSLPGPIRKKMGMVEESEENDEEGDSGREGLQRYESDDGEEAKDDAAEKKKKQISMIIRVVIILGIGYYAVDEFVLKKNKGGDKAAEEMLATAPVARKGRKNKQALAKEAAAAAAAAAGASATGAITADGAKTDAALDAASAEDPTTATTTATPNTPETPTQAPPIENINILDKNGPVIASPESQLQIETPATESAPEITETKIVDTSVDKKLDQLVDNVEQEPATVEEVKIPSQSPSQKNAEVTQTQEEPTPKKDTSMASKIVEVATETPAPAYDQVGRGLVYNCKDKYWACVDKPAYLLCNRNMKWNKSKGNGMECVVQNIYNSDDDCAKVQKYNVSTSVATGFCQ